MAQKMSASSTTAPSTPVLRVKRRRSQSPAGALVIHLSAKKKRENEDSISDPNSTTATDSPSKAVFKFAATLDKNDHGSIKDALDKVGHPKSDPKLLKRILDTKSKTSKSSESDSTKKRYKVISQARGIDLNKTDEATNDDELDDESDRLYKLVDLIKSDNNADSEKNKEDKNDLDMPNVSNPTEKVDQITCNGVPLVKLAEEEYVYDVYTMQSDAFSSTDSDVDQSNIFSAQDFDATNIVDISFLDCRDMAEDDEEAWRKVMDGDDSDSNDEDHWKNDYPDEEDEFSEADDDAYYRDDDLDLDFERFHIRHGNREIGSSASEESDDDDEFGDEDGLVHSRSESFVRDADLHGTSYAKWKRKMVKQMGDENSSEEDDINEVDEF